MENKLKNKFDIKVLKKNIKRLDHKHTHDRKIKFLLDIRGYLKINKLIGNYVEFGSFLSEMQVASFFILEKNCKIDSFIGLDKFENNKNSFNSNIVEIKKNLSLISNKLKVKKIDLEKNDQITNFLNKKNIVVSVIDCNLFRPLINSLENSIKYIVNGGVIYIDDYFLIKNNKLILLKQIKKLSKLYNVIFEDFQTYPPFAKAFIIFKK